MIGKILRTPVGRDFKDVINRTISGCEFVDTINLISLDTSIIEMNSTAFLCPSSSDPIIHAMMSWAPGETLSYNDIRFAVITYLHEMDMDKCQTIYALFTKNDRKYVHIISSRINPINLKPVAPNHGWTYKAMQNACKILSKSENESINQSDKRTHISNEIASYYEFITGRRSNISIAFDLLSSQKFRSWGEFHAFNSSYGMRYELRTRGAVFLLGNIYCKASSISREYSLPKMEIMFGSFVPSRSVHDPKLFPISTPIIEYIDQNIFSEYDIAIENRKNAIDQSYKELLSEHNQESYNLRNIQRKESENLFARKDKIYDNKRFYDRLQFLRLKHDEENIAMQEKFNIQCKQLRELNKKQFPKIPKFSDWLSSTGKKLLSELYRYRNNPNKLIQLISYRLDQIRAFKLSFIEDDMSKIIKSAIQSHEKLHELHLQQYNDLLDELKSLLSDPPLPESITERLFGVSRSRLEEYNNNIRNIREKIFDLRITLSHEVSYDRLSSDITAARRILEDKYNSQFPEQYNEEISLKLILENITNIYIIP